MSGFEPIDDKTREQRNEDRRRPKPAPPKQPNRLCRRHNHRSRRQHHLDFIGFFFVAQRRQDHRFTRYERRSLIGLLTDGLLPIEQIVQMTVNRRVADEAANIAGI